MSDINVDGNYVPSDYDDVDYRTSEESASSLEEVDVEGEELGHQQPCWQPRCC